MPDLMMIVDTALSEVPVNIMPLIDDGDFKTIEASVAYNAAGMALKWNFTTVGGATTQTAVTPTTSGDYDWVAQGNGMYTIEIPASGGASINNDTEGFGWFSGVATGVLPWRGPIVQFSPANVVNSLVPGSDLLDVNTAQINGVAAATPGASGGILISGSNSGTTTFGALTVTGAFTVTGATVLTGNVSMAAGLTITQSVSNGHGISVTGNGTGHGILSTSGSGATGNGIQATSAATNGNGLSVLGNGTGNGLLATGGAGAGGDGFEAVAGGGVPIRGDITGNITGNLSGSVGSVTGLVTANVTQISGDSGAADALESILDGGGGTITADITGNLSGSVGSVTGAVGSVTGNVGGNVTGSIGSLATQAKADVNAEVVDCLNVDTYAQPGQATPAATASIVTKLGYLHKAWRNRTTQTASQYSLYNDDAATVDQKASFSDDTVTADRGEVATGP